MSNIYMDDEGNAICEDTDEYTEDCDCDSCEQSRKEAYREFLYDSIKNGDFNN